MERAALLRDPDTRRVYEQEYLFGEVTETIGALVTQLGLSRADLARRLGLSRGRVTQVLSGTENLTLKTLADLGWALGVRFNLDPQPMNLKVGTPAVDDPPLPTWVEGMRHATLRIHVAPTDVWRPTNRHIHPEPVWTVTKDSSADSPASQSEVAA